MNKIPSFINFSYQEAFMTNWVFFVLGISILIIARAFLTGAEMKNEQDLTV